MHISFAPQDIFLHLKKKKTDTSMETKLQLPADFEPYCRWRREEHQYVLKVHLKGGIYKYF